MDPPFLCCVSLRMYIIPTPCPSPVPLSDDRETNRMMSASNHYESFICAVIWQYPFHKLLWVRGRVGITCHPAFLTSWTRFLVSAFELRGYGLWFLLCCEAAIRLTALSWVVAWNSVIKSDLCLPGRNGHHAVKTYGWRCSSMHS
jgi:hypothetical protein